MLIKRHSSFEAAAGDWRALAAEMPANPLAGPDWWQCWLTPADRSPPVIVTAHWPDGRPAMLLALARRRLGPITLLEPVGGRLAPARAMLVSPALAHTLDAAGATRLIEAMAKAAGGADLVLLPDQPATLGGIANPLLGLSAQSPSRLVAVSQVCRPWDRFDARHRGSKTRRKEQRRERQLAERGPLRFRIAATQTERAAFASELLRQRTCTKGASECRRPLESVACSSLVNRIAALDGTSGGPAAWLTALESNGKLLSVALGVVEHGTYVGLHLSLAEGEDCTHGPADLLVTRTLRHAVEGGLATFSFPPLASSRLDHWTDTLVELHQVSMPLTRLGRLARRMLLAGPAAAPDGNRSLGAQA